MKKITKLLLHYVMLMIALFVYHFYFGMQILTTYGEAVGFVFYSVLFFIVLVASDQVLHKVFGLK